MMDDLQDLYQQVILDHGKNPRNFREIEGDCKAADGYNPLCGDQVRIFSRVEDGEVTDASFTGKGCAICTASASMMTQTIKNKKVEDINAMFETFHHMVTAKEEDTAGAKSLGKLGVFVGVRKYPMRVKCASLPWHTLQSALSDGEMVSTE